MSRMSASFIAKKIGMETKWVYQLWQKMGLICKNKLGDWALTELGRQYGGKMSIGSYLSVPTFQFEIIEKLMIDFFNSNKK